MQANDGNSSGVSTIILGLVVLALAGTAGTIGLLRQVGEFGPKVGDIVSFDPHETLSRDMQAKIAATRASDRSERTCVLDINAMHASGGSMVIESRQPQTSSGYRVHWVGAPSSDDPASCGASADLLLNQEDIEILALAAGGYGVSARRLTANALWSARTSTQ
jgi:hypothetical protein